MKKLIGKYRRTHQCFASHVQSLWSKQGPNFKLYYLLLLNAPFAQQLIIFFIPVSSKNRVPQAVTVRWYSYVHYANMF